MTYTQFLEAEIQVALKKVEKYGYDQPLIKPEGEDELEQYLSEILGIISFNETVNKFYRGG